jgi:hypothetical protein
MDLRPAPPDSSRVAATGTVCIWREEEKGEREGRGGTSLDVPAGLWDESCNDSPCTKCVYVFACTHQCMCVCVP